jgi:tetratricopeptide (TPR) repeat protein
LPPWRIATLALDARDKGKVTTADAIARYEEVLELDAGVHWDWVELGRLYHAGGRLRDAQRAAQVAADTPTSERERMASLYALADVLVSQGDTPGALTDYRAGLAIAERLARADARNTQWQRDLSLSHDKMGDALVAQGDVPGALTSYRAGLAIRERLARTDASNTDWQRDLSVSLERIGDMLMAQGDVPGALTSYRAGLAIREHLARTENRRTPSGLWTWRWRCSSEVRSCQPTHG